MAGKNILETIAGEIRKDNERVFGSSSFPGPEDIETNNRCSLIRKLDREFGIIAEIKRASPSRGPLCREPDILKRAAVYEEAGAAAVSVVTEKRHFSGHPRDLARVRSLTGLPILRKDFILHPGQVYESRELGADCLLLIVSLLSDRELTRLTGYCRQLGMEPLIEVHGRKEVERLFALDLNPRLVGINNRDLTRFKVDIRHSLQLKPVVDRLTGSRKVSLHLISESGVKNREDVRILREEGFSGVLVGEALMVRPNPGELIREWLN